MSNQQELGNAAGLLWSGAEQKLEILEVRVTPETMAYMVHRFPERIAEGDRLSKPNDAAHSINLMGVRFTTARKPSRFLKWCLGIDRWLAKITRRK